MKSVFERLDKGGRKHILFFSISMSVLFLMYLVCIEAISKSYEISQDDFSWVYQIDSVTEREEILEIKGWAFALNQDATGDAFEIVLRDIETGKKVYGKMNYEIRKDVNNYFLCEYDYSKSGFTVTISTKKLDDVVYEIILKPLNVRKAYATELFLYNGEVSEVNPNEFIQLDVADTDLENIVSRGKLKSNRPQEGMYVYQYENALYWIAEEKFDLEGMGSWIQFHLNTTQIDRLPSERLENEWYWSNLSFYFQENEIVDCNTGNYRVSKHELPIEYSIYQIFTGRYEEDWIWRDDFRPTYTFH